MSSFDRRKIIDLTQIFEPGMPVMPALPPPAIWPVLRQDDGDYVNSNVVQYCEHSGTHLDSPAHIVKGGTTLESLPLDSLMGPAVVLDLTSKEGDVPIDVSDLEDAQRSASQIESGDVVLLRSDHSLLWDVKPRGRAFIANGWPYLTAEAAKYLLRAGIRALGVESPDPDRLGTTEFPAHYALLPAGIPIIENLCNLNQIPRSRCDFIALPLKVRGGTGGPCRALAFV